MHKKIFLTLIASIIITAASGTSVSAAPLTFNKVEFGAVNHNFSRLIGGFIFRNQRYYLAHFQDPGFPFFNAEKYALANPDVVAVVGNDPEKLLYHYLSFGAYEGRSCGTATDPIVAIVTHSEVLTGNESPEAVIAAFAKVTGTTSTEGILLGIADNGTLAVKEVAANAPAGASIPIAEGVTFGGKVAVNNVTGQNSVASIPATSSNSGVSLNRGSSLENGSTTDNGSITDNGSSSDSRIGFDSWLAAVPLPDNYADGKLYSSAVASWLAKGIAKGWVIKTGDDIKIPGAWYDVGGYVYECAKWLDDKPELEDYILYDEFNAAHKNWEESFPNRNAAEYIYDVTGYQIACELYKKVYPEPLIEDYTDTEAYEYDHRSWQGNYPDKICFNSIGTVDKVDAKGKEYVENLYNMLKPQYKDFGFADDDINAFKAAHDEWEAKKSLTIDSVKVGVYSFGGKTFDINTSHYDLYEAYGSWDSEQKIKADIQATEFDDLLKNVFWDFGTFKLVNIDISGYDTFTVAIGAYDREKIINEGWPDDSFITPVEEVKSIYEAYKAANIPDDNWIPNKNYTDYAITETKYTFAGDDTKYETMEAAQAAIDAAAGDEPLLESFVNGYDDYKKAVDSWEDNTPDYSKFICDSFDDENYTLILEGHELSEPTIEEYTHYMVFDIDTGIWKDSKPEKEDFTICEDGGSETPTAEPEE